MPPKPPGQVNNPGKSNEQRRSILVVPSKIVSRPDELEGGEETEIAAQIEVPEEGGWGWVVLAASFWSLFVLDGVCFTFGTMIIDMRDDLGVEDSLVAFINSLAVALYFILGPLGSALINRFGFRSCAMSGSIVVCGALLCAYFSTSYATVCLFYGGFAGFGYCLINLSAGLILGFYFERLRSLALAIGTTGSSVGIASMSSINAYLVNIAGWRVLTLLHTGLFGTIYFMSMTYRPLLSFTVVTNVDDPTRTVTYLPNLSATTTKTEATKKQGEGLAPTVAERLFSAVSNANFPTAASVVEEGIPTTATPGPSTQPISKLILTTRSPDGGISKRQMKQVQSIISRSSMQDKAKKNIEVTVHTEKPRKTSCWGRLCIWEEHVPESRPLYRDDAFYGGNIEKLEVYQKSVMDTTAETRTGLEYRMAVSRAVTTNDLKEKRGIFTTAARRVLATMMDPKLLTRGSFLLMCASGFLAYMGYLVPYVYLADRNLKAGIESHHCMLFLTVIGFCNTLGRLSIGAIALKIDPLKLYAFASFISGVSTILSDFSYNVYYQYSYCVIFGFFISSLANLRSMVIVNLYGLDKLTNATGMLLLFQGIGTLISTPLAAFIGKNFGYTISFYVAGIFLTISSITLLPIRSIANREKIRHAATTHNVSPNDKVR